MVASLLHPLNIFIVGLGGGFLIPLLYRLGKSWAAAGFVAALGAMTLMSGHALLALVHGGAPIEIVTGGAFPPYAINLRMGLAEAAVAFSVNLVALIGARYVLRDSYGILLLYLLLIVGIQGMVMTRDLFNLFVFLEIVSIATYGLLSLNTTPAALSATFKFLMATVLASTFFLIGTMLVYAVTGLLNIDELIAARDTIAGPTGFAALMFLLASLILELKPFPANGWGLDVYETARSDVAALISGGASAGVFFALFKLLPLFQDHLELIAALAAVTFVGSNLVGLRQTKAQRLLGYSSVGQMALMTIAACLLERLGAKDQVGLVVGGLFLNHLFAKVGLFWLAGHVRGERLGDWAALAARKSTIVVFAILIVAICGLPPFPGFWAKWQLVLTLAAGQLYVWIAVLLLGALLEAAYMFRWLGVVVPGDAAAETRSPRAGAEADSEMRSPGSTPELLPVYAMAVLLVLSGALAAEAAGLSAAWPVLPLVAGLAVAALAALPSRGQGFVTLGIVLAGGLWLALGMTGIAGLFAGLLLAGGLVISVASLAQTDRRPGFYPLLAVLLLSLPALARATTSLEFLFIWELITLSSYFLVLQRRKAAPHALRYLMFSLLAASFLLAGFALLYGETGSLILSGLGVAGQGGAPVFVLLALGLLIKAGAVGVHVWLPDTYAEADDDVSALLSAVVSKVAMFGLLVGTYAAIRSEANLGLAHVLGWIGMLTTLAGAMMAVAQDDLKRMLAYSSMSQLGYIVAAIALMSHLGWVTALYLVANHLMVKGILFLVAAAIILRTGRRRLQELGGLARAMPATFGAAVIAIVAMSGLPPLAGFGGKWLLLSAMMEKGWYGPAAMTLLATFVGFLYMVRFVREIFLGARRSGREAVADAPPALIVPQYLLVAGILVMSFFPKLLIGPISAAIDPQFASTLVWQGMSLEMIYGSWNPVPVMAFAVVVSAVLFGLFWLLRRTGLVTAGRAAARAAGRATGSNGTHEFATAICAALTPPLAARFWDGLAAATTGFGERTRRLYDGHGQTYNLYMLYYFIVLYFSGGGFVHLWPGN